MGEKAQEMTSFSEQIRRTFCTLHTSITISQQSKRGEEIVALSYLNVGIYIFPSERILVLEMFLVIFIGLLTLLAFATYRYYRFVGRYPKGPTPLPFIGNSLEVRLLFLSSLKFKISSEELSRTRRIVCEIEWGIRRTVHNILSFSYRSH